MSRNEEVKNIVYYSTNEVADILRLTKRSIYRIIDTGELRAIKIGGWKISHEDLQDFIDSRESNRKKWLDIKKSSIRWQSAELPTDNRIIDNTFWRKYI